MIYLISLLKSKGKKNLLIFNFAVILFFLILPYYLFQGKLFIGGDDTRLLYVYPLEFLKNISFFSWYNFSSVGSYNPNQFSVPFTLIWSLLFYLIRSRIIIDYFAFSLPIILGFIYFKKLARSLINSEKYNFEITIGSLIYVLSPIISLNQYSVFLYAAWLIGLLPIMSYYFLSYLKTGRLSYILKNVLFSIFLSLALFSIPWLLGFFLPVALALLFTVHLYKKQDIYLFIKRTFVFFTALILSQAFWLVPFVTTFLGGGNNSFGGQVLSKQTANSFNGTVLATASGSILFPILNLFHRQIAFDFNWPLKMTYQIFYDRFIFADVIFIVIFFLGIFYAKVTLTSIEIKKFITILIAFLVSLFLFTVNIGPLKELFLLFGHIPGFVMFRNFYDKFALGYTLIYALLITFSLIITAKRFPTKRYLIALLFSVVVLINFLPVRQVIVRPLWQTSANYTNITISDEYLDFMQAVNKNVSPSSNIFSIPFNIASYTFIKDTTSENIFAGTSPVRIFSRINDYSGELSFPSYESGRITQLIENKDYKSLKQIFEKYNISYLIVTKNIPYPVKHSYLFKKRVLEAQDSKFIKNIAAKIIAKSSSGNYELYSLKNIQNAIQGKGITYTKINPTEYHIHISHFNGNETLKFLDSYHKDWKLYVNKYTKNDSCISHGKYSPDKTECIKNQQLVSGNELPLLFKKTAFDSSHSLFSNYSNRWEIDTDIIKKYPKETFYKENADGSINLDLILYFRPQSYFYIGSIITLVTTISLIFIILRKRRR